MSAADRLLILSLEGVLCGCKVFLLCVLGCRDLVFFLPGRGFVLQGGFVTRLVLCCMGGFVAREGSFVARGFCYTSCSVLHGGFRCKGGEFCC